MVGKAQSISHTSNAVDYARNKQNSEELCRSDTIIGITGEEISKEFKVYQNLNQNCRKNTISVVLSPEPEDGKKITRQDFKEITQNYLQKMDLEKHQYIAYTHADRDHKHIHLFVNRIDNQGVAYKDSFIGKKSQQMADQIAQEKGLVRAKEVELSKINNHKELRAEIYFRHKEVLKENPNNFQEYVLKMENKGIEIQPTINNQGKLQGYRVEYQGQNFKASECHRSMSYNKLQQTFEKQSDLGLKSKNIQVLKDHRLVMKNKPKNFSQYQKSMQDKGYHVSNILGKEAKSFIIMAEREIMQGKVHMTKEEY